MPEEREYTIVKLSPALSTQITGNCSDNLASIPWDMIPILPIDTLLWTDPIDIRAFAQICYDEKALYVRLTAEEKEIRAVETSETGMPCEDSCLEFFFSPISGDLRYFNIEFNPNCCMYLGLGGTDLSELVRLLPPENPFTPAAERTDNGWRVTYRIPYSFICHFFPSFAAKSGTVIRANCYKCGDLTVKEHYLSWNPIKWNTPRFHKPDDFGIMIFE